MNIAEEFTTWMEDSDLGTFGTDIYIGEAPIDAPSRCWWVVASGGNTSISAQTGERMKNYLLSVYFRSEPQDVYDTLQSFEELCNGKDCIEFSNYDIIELQATQYASDQDLDSEERKVGLVQINLTVYSN